jgi:hypothetical protein
MLPGPRSTSGEATLPIFFAYTLPRECEGIACLRNLRPTGDRQGSELMFTFLYCSLLTKTRVIPRLCGVAHSTHSFTPQYERTTETRQASSGIV